MLRPGIVWRPSATVVSPPTRVRVRRGGLASAADIRVVAPSTWAIDGPNIATAVRSAEPVVRWTTVASARLDMVAATVDSALLHHSARNSGWAKSAR